MHILSHLVVLDEHVAQLTFPYNTNNSMCIYLKLSHTQYRLFFGKIKCLTSYPTLYLCFEPLYIYIFLFSPSIFHVEHFDHIYAHHILFMVVHLA